MLDSLTVTWAEALPELREGGPPRLFSRRREGEIWISRHDRFVLKVLEDGQGPKAHEQFCLLGMLSSQGLPVPRPAGWGTDSAGRGVLAMRDSGPPLGRPTNPQLRELGGILAAIHGTDPRSLRPYLPPQTEPGHLDRLFAGIEQHPDMAQSLALLRQNLHWEAVRPVHGDFHLGNICLQAERLIVVDWTDAGIGDARYDLAWAIVLLLLYTGHRAAETFRRSYSARYGPQHGEQSSFDALAALRWILLYRSAPVPVERQKAETAYAYLRSRLPAGVAVPLQTLFQPEA
jgi:aminoglycoside phosphotransferase (APT) family kinase protein